MPRKPNYGLNKHRKEQDRKAKKDAKLLERQQRRDDRVDLNAPNPVATPGADSPVRGPGNESS